MRSQKRLEDDTMIDQVDVLIQKILAVPFGRNYNLSAELLQQLNEDFFKECFVRPSYDLKKNIHNIDGPVKTAFEIDLSTKELLDNAEKIQNNETAFLNWLNDQTNNVYYVRGDAGTGKTTYLHWLKYRAEHEKPEEGWKWEIIDLAEADEDITILDITVHIPAFDLLYYKVISAIIKSINEKLYPERYEKKPIDHDKAATRFKMIYSVFENKFDCFYPDSRVRYFFNNLPLKTGNVEEKTNKQICEDCGHFVAQSFKDILDENNKEEALRLFLQIYLYILRCFDEHAKFVVVIDNVERIIGSDEIFNAEITEFATALRTMQTAIANNNVALQLFYKLAVFMRNTSVRMLTPQQITDTRANTFDMSDWFDVEAIILNKIHWYEKQGEKLSAAEELLDILQDNYDDNGDLRGLYTKLKMIFNNNKRVIVHFLIHVLGRKSNQTYIKIYNHLRKRKLSGLTESLTRFATRSIIYRLLLNEMRQDDFFHAIMAEPVTKSKSDTQNREEIDQEKNIQEKINQDEKDYGAAAVGYARRILTLAYEYELNNRDDPYMPLSDILCNVFGMGGRDIDQFFSNENSYSREVIADILFAMNYYNGRKGDWLQFVDIQYYPEGTYRSVQIPNADRLKDLLEQGLERIRVKITTAGVAYLYFIVFSYEYFACKSMNSPFRKEIIGEYDIPPLLCTIPTRDQIVNSKIADLECIKTIEIVLIEALRCITKMNRDEQQGIFMFPFRRALDKPHIKHTVRIVNSHRGYLDNFVECLLAVYKKDKDEDKEFEEHLDLLVSTIQRMRDYYQYYASDIIENYKKEVQATLIDMQQKKDELCKK